MKWSQFNFRLIKTTLLALAFVFIRLAFGLCIRLGRSPQTRYQVTRRGSRESTGLHPSGYADASIGLRWFFPRAGTSSRSAHRSPPSSAEAATRSRVCKIVACVTRRARRRLIAISCNSFRRRLRGTAGPPSGAWGTPFANSAPTASLIWESVSWPAAPTTGASFPIAARVLGEDSLVAQGGETAGLPSLADVGVPKRLRKKVVEKAKESCKDDL